MLVYGDGSPCLNDSSSSGASFGVAALSFSGCASLCGHLLWFILALSLQLVSITAGSAVIHRHLVAALVAARLAPQHSAEKAAPATCPPRSLSVGWLWLLTRHVTIPLHLHMSAVTPCGRYATAMHVFASLLLGFEVMTVTILLECAGWLCHR